MPTYDYKCDKCEHRFDAVQSIMAQPLTKCPQCTEEGLRRILHAVSVFSRQEASTLGQQADRNTSKMGTYELQDKRQQQQERAVEHRKSRPQAERPWWRDYDKVDTQLAKLAPAVIIENGKITKQEPMSEKAMDYIMTGKL